MARPPYKATDLARELVAATAALGFTHEKIATVLDISPKTLRKHFRPQLNKAAIQANAKVMQSLFDMATSGKNTSATIFWAKSRCGLKDKTDESLPSAELPQITVKVE